MTWSRGRPSVDRERGGGRSRSRSRSRSRIASRVDGAGVEYGAQEQKNPKPKINPFGRSFVVPSVVHRPLSFVGYIRSAGRLACQAFEANLVRTRSRAHICIHACYPTFASLTRICPVVACCAQSLPLSLPLSQSLALARSVATYPPHHIASQCIRTVPSRNAMHRRSSLRVTSFCPF